MMKQNSREQMIEGALALLSKQGLQATSFSEVLKLTGAPRGSIYYHFPGGKDQLIAEALELAKEQTALAVKGIKSTKPDRIVEDFFGLWRATLLASNFASGSAVTAVTIAMQNLKLLESARSILQESQEILAGRLKDAGFPEERAISFAATIVAASEGAVVLARATQDIALFDRVAEQLIQQAKEPAMRNENILWTRQEG